MLKLKEWKHGTGEKMGVVCRYCKMKLADFSKLHRHVYGNRCSGGKRSAVRQLVRTVRDRLLFRNQNLQVRLLANHVKTFMGRRCASMAEQNLLSLELAKKIPYGKYDLIVSPSRQGLVVGSIVSMYLQIPMTTPECVKHMEGMGRWWDSGRLKDCRNVLIVDDSLGSGKSVESAKSAIKSAMPDSRTDVAVIFIGKGASRSTARKVRYHVAATDMRTGQRTGQSATGKPINNLARLSSAVELWRTLEKKPLSCTGRAAASWK